MFDLNKITRENVKQLKPYSSARDEFKGQADVWLDANENPFDSGLNRYPDPLAIKVKERIAELKEVGIENIFLGNGSDEAIDLLFRAFCEPNNDKVLIMPPTYGMYEVSAGVNAVEVLKIPLREGFEINAEVLKPYLSDGQLKLIFICSPNNPTGNLMSQEAIHEIAENFHGIVVIDEAYVDFASDGSLLSDLNKLPNLVILQTFSKAWGMAGIRLGMAFASKQVIDILNRIKPPYNVNSITQRMALEQLTDENAKNSAVTVILRERELLQAKLEELPNVTKVHPSDANFLLVQFTNPNEVYSKLAREGIIVRNRNSVIEGCLRITVGTPEENIKLLNSLTPSPSL